MDAVDLLEQQVAGEQNRILAAKIIYTSDETPERTADEIVEALGDARV